jgi:hypothetical protein
MVIGLAVMTAAVMVSVLYLFDVTQMVRDLAEVEDEEVAFPAPQAPLYEPTDPQVEVRIFFAATNNDVLIRTRTMTIFESAEIANQARQIIDHLIQGPGNPNLFSALPADTRLNHIFISENGTAYVDFNSALADNHPGGIMPEQATVFSIVNSLVYNLEGIDRVKILIGGAEKETLAGHCLLLLPFETDLSITDIASQALQSTGTETAAP